MWSRIEHRITFVSDIFTEFLLWVITIHILISNDFFHHIFRQTWKFWWRKQLQQQDSPLLLLPLQTPPPLKIQFGWNPYQLPGWNPYNLGMYFVCKLFINFKYLLMILFSWWFFFQPGWKPELPERLWKRLVSWTTTDGKQCKPYSVKT